jgi:hypothetical protein
MVCTRLLQSDSRHLVETHPPGRPRATPLPEGSPRTTPTVSNAHMYREIPPRDYGCALPRTSYATTCSGFRHYETKRTSGTNQPPTLPAILRYLSTVSCPSPSERAAVLPARPSAYNYVSPNTQR